MAPVPQEGPNTPTHLLSLLIGHVNRTSYPRGAYQVHIHCIWRPHADPYLAQHPEQTDRAQERPWRIHQGLRCQPAVPGCRKTKSVVRLFCARAPNNPPQSPSSTTSAMTTRHTTTGSTPPSPTSSACSRSSTSPSARPATHPRHTARLPPCGSVLTLSPPGACPAPPSLPRGGCPCLPEGNAGLCFPFPCCSSMRRTYARVL